MPNLLNQILAYLGGIVAVGTSAALAAYGMFRLFATKWIETRFSERLEAFRHRQNQEIEHLRFQINTQFDRLTKLHQHEFEALPQIWSLAYDAYHKTSRITGGLSSHPDLERMGERQFSEFVDACRLNNWEKEELKELKFTDRNRYYMKQIFWHDFNDAYLSGGAFQEHLLKGDIFIEKEISVGLHRLLDVITTVLIREQYQDRGRSQGDLSTHDLMSKQAKPLMTEIGDAIRRRLWTQPVEESPIEPDSEEK